MWTSYMDYDNNCSHMCIIAAEPNSKRVQSKKLGWLQCDKCFLVFQPTNLTYASVSRDHENSLTLLCINSII